MEITPEEWVQINAGDAAKLGIKNSDLVVVFSQDNPEGVKAKAMVTEGMRRIVTPPRGRWDTGPSLSNWMGRGPGAPMDRPGPLRCRRRWTLERRLYDDPIGGSASFYDSRVGIRKA
jgi:anaerobic selenocysteine-containing dehydrogenase